MKRVLISFFAVGILFVCAACGHRPDAKKIGVFADTDKGLLELTLYGEEYLGFMDAKPAGYHMPKGATPYVNNIRALYVNMPDVKISNCRVFWSVKNIDLSNFKDAFYAPENTATELVKGNLYKISSSEMTTRHGGFLLFKVGMAYGTPDRLYPIAIGPVTTEMSGSTK